MNEIFNDYTESEREAIINKVKLKYVLQNLYTFLNNQLQKFHLASK
jgi:hypothetical protein